jgi:hypothetical protein
LPYRTLPVQKTLAKFFFTKCCSFPVHEVQVDKLLLDRDVLIVENVGEEPDRLLAEGHVVGRQQGRHDRGKVGVLHKVNIVKFIYGIIPLQMFFGFILSCQSP